jgi:hypothetical protein
MSDEFGFQLCDHGSLSYLCGECPKQYSADHATTCPHGLKKGCRYCNAPRVVTTAVEVRCVYGVANTCTECNVIVMHNYHYNKTADGVVHLDCIHNAITECMQCNAQRAEKLNNDYAAIITANQIVAGLTPAMREALRTALSKTQPRQKSRFRNTCHHKTGVICDTCNRLQHDVVVVEYEKIREQLNVVVDSLEPTNPKWNAVENRFCQHTPSNRCQVCSLQIVYDSEFMNAHCGHQIVRKTCVICCMNAKCVHGAMRRFCNACFSPETVDALWKSDCVLTPLTFPVPVPETQQKRKSANTNPPKRQRQAEQSKSTTEDAPIPVSIAADMLTRMSSV